MTKASDLVTSPVRRLKGAWSSVCSQDASKAAYPGNNRKQAKVRFLPVATAHSILSGVDEALLITDCFYFGVSIYIQKARYRPLSVLDGRKQKRVLLSVDVLQERNRMPGSPPARCSLIRHG